LNVIKREVLAHSPNKEKVYRLLLALKGRIEDFSTRFELK